MNRWPYLPEPEDEPEDRIEDDERPEPEPDVWDYDVEDHDPPVRGVLVSRGDP